MKIKRIMWLQTRTLWGKLSFIANGVSVRTSADQNLLPLTGNTVHVMQRSCLVPGCTKIWWETHSLQLTGYL